MLRDIYRCALRLHPPGFRRRFGGEMLSIFDQAHGTLAALQLLLDGILSLARQWALRPEFWAEVPQSQPIPEGIPTFSSLDPFRPRAAAIIHGTILSITLFCATCFAIRYSWIRVLHVHIPEVVFESHPSWSPGSTPTDLRGKPASPRVQNAARPSTSLQSASGPPHLSVEPIPVEPVEAPLASAATTSNQATPGTSVALPSAVAFEVRLEAYRGVYVSDTPKLTVAITAKDAQLVMDAAGRRQTLSPLSRTTFLGDNGTHIEFAAERGGKFHQLLLSLDGQQITAERR